MKFGRTLLRSYALPTTIAFLALAFVAVSGVKGEVASQEEMQQVCQNWLTQQVAFTGAWAGESNPQIITSNDIYSGDTVVARWFDIAPRGFVLVPVLKEMSPVKMYSDETNLDSLQEGGVIAMISESFSLLYGDYVRQFGSLEAPQPPAGDAVFSRQHRAHWDELLISNDQFKARMFAKKMPFASVGPLTTTGWKQRAPYNNLCPVGDSGKTTVVGCVATAAAQIMKYWNWPTTGVGSHTYTWAGDNSCGGSTPSQDLTADFSDPYDWANMPDSCPGGCTTVQQAALAELSYEVGVAFDMDYGSCASGAYTSIAPEVYTNYFRYAPDARKEYRSLHDLSGWFSLIQEEINASRVILYTISRHAIVCDGWRDSNGKPEFHMNYGWGGTATAWYVLDSLYCYWEPNNHCPADIESMTTHLHPLNTPYLERHASTLTEFNGNGDGHAEAGETVDLTVTLGNTGLDATGISVSVTSSDPYVTVINPTANYNDIPWRGEGTSLTPFRLQFAPGCPDPHTALVALNIVAAGGYSSADTILLFAGNTAGLTEDAESGQGYWSHQTPTPAFIDQWHLETNRVHGGTQSWKMGGAGSGSYANMVDAWLISPPFLLPSDPQLKMWHWMAAEIFDDTTAWDGGVVMISSDGYNWTQLTPDGGYPYRVVDVTDGNFAPLTPCFSNQQAWTLETFDLAGHSGVVQVAFRFASDGATVEEGWYVDDVAVAGAGCCVGLTGNVDCGAGDGVDIGDLTVLIDNLFISFTPLCCKEEANCDGDAGNQVDIGDLTNLIDNLFISFQALPACQ